jgi:hypothetical protein
VCCVCCQVEVSATNWSLVQRSLTDCDASLCVIIKTRQRGHRPRLGRRTKKTNKQTMHSHLSMRATQMRQSGIGLTGEMFRLVWAGLGALYGPLIPNVCKELPLYDT